MKDPRPPDPNNPAQKFKQPPNSTRSQQTIRQSVHNSHTDTQPSHSSPATQSASQRRLSIYLANPSIRHTIVSFKKKER